MLVYRALGRLAVPAVPLLLRDARQRAAHRARLAAPADLAAWAGAHRDPTRPLVWWHASSVGEGLQARAVIDALRALAPGPQLIYTHYSPSAETFAVTIDADWSGYLCYDRRRDVDRMLGAATPDLLVFTKVDLWPNLGTRAAARGTRVALVAATVSRMSGRLRWPIRQLTQDGYRALDLVVAAGTDDVPRLVQLGCRRDRIVVGGDPRIDSVLDVARAAGASLVGGGTHPPEVMIAGSTWPADEAVVLPAFAAVRERFPRARLVIVPHDPSEAHLQQVDALARDAGLPGPVRLSALPAGETPPTVLVDQVGILARLYASGGMAYVGGGFGGKGIHSVLEPAAWSRPVIVGPRERGSRDAELLAWAGALEQLPAHRAVESLTSIWSRWLERPDIAATAGAAGRHALETERGAAARTAKLLVSLLPNSTGDRPARERNPVPG